MGRSRKPLSAAQADAALGYLQRALDRKADIFVAGLKETGRSLATLRRHGLTQRQGDFATETSAWLDRNVTKDGRKALLAALRQARAQEQRPEPIHSVRLPASVHAELSKLAERLKLSLPATVAHLVAASERG